VGFYAFKFIDNLAGTWLFGKRFLMDLFSQDFILIRILNIVIIVVTLCLQLVLRNLAIMLVEESFLAPATLLVYCLVRHKVGVLAFRAL
jgi:hypothetical protein